MEDLGYPCSDPLGDSFMFYIPDNVIIFVQDFEDSISSFLILFTAVLLNV